MNETFSKQATTIDLLKFLFSICIVGIHTKVLIETTDAVQWYVTHLLFRLGVPFFFCVSGYFLGCKLWKNANCDEIFKSYRRRLIPPLLLWGGVGLIFYAIELYARKVHFVGIVLRLVRMAIFYPQGAMWYVGACIIAAYLVQIFWKSKYRDRWLWGIGISGYVFALLANTYYFLIDDTFLGKGVSLYLKVCVSARNGIFVGLIFLWIGIMLARWSTNGKEVGNGIKIIFVISFILYVIEIYYAFGKNVADDSALFVSHLVLIPSGILLALKYNIKNLPFSKELRGMSTCIYFTHAFFNNLIGYFVSFGVMRFVMVICACVLVYFYQMKYKNKYLEKVL